MSLAVMVVSAPSLGCQAKKFFQTSGRSWKENSWNDVMWATKPCRLFDLGCPNGELHGSGVVWSTQEVRQAVFSNGVELAFADKKFVKGIG